MAFNIFSLSQYLEIAVFALLHAILNSLTNFVIFLFGNTLHLVNEEPILQNLTTSQKRLYNHDFIANKKKKANEKEATDKLAHIKKETLKMKATILLVSVDKYKKRSRTPRLHTKSKQELDVQYKLLVKELIKTDSAVTVQPDMTLPTIIADLEPKRLDEKHAESILEKFKNENRVIEREAAPANFLDEIESTTDESISSEILSDTSSSVSEYKQTSQILVNQAQSSVSQNLLQNPDRNDSNLNSIHNIQYLDSLDLSYWVDPMDCSEPMDIDDPPLSCSILNSTESVDYMVLDGPVGGCASSFIQTWDPMVLDYKREIDMDFKMEVEIDNRMEIAIDKPIAMEIENAIGIRNHPVFVPLSKFEQLTAFVPVVVEESQTINEILIEHLDNIVENSDSEYVQSIPSDELCSFEGTESGSESDSEYSEQITRLQ
eukprot:NODE_150_length_15491_cov_0.365644.p6 type:complete len:432 gc:universal NODE_150_length_15491_cov_0.365644:6741-5446(-)